MIIILACNCHHFGSLDINCDKFGSCSCKAGFIGPKCNKCADDYFGADENCLRKFELTIYSERQKKITLI